VVAVYVRGSTWQGNDNVAGNVTYMEYLESKGIGDDVYGFRVDNLGVDTPLPWINLDQIVVRYSAVGEVPTPGMFTVAGRNPAASSYSVSSLSQIPGDPQTLVLTLNKPLGGGNPVTGVAPTPAENGDRIRFTDPSGGAGGAPYSLLLNILQGDTDHFNEGANHVVLARDYSEIKKKFFKNTNTVPTGADTDYNPFYDIDGTGNILARDYSEVKKRFFQTLSTAAAIAPVPTAAAAPSLFGASRIADEVL
jgi:hypothetical protein